MSLRLFVAIATCVLVSVPSFSATLLVPSGHSTLTAAVQAADPLDVIEVAPGTYSASTGETFPINLGTKALTLVGAGIESAILDGEDLQTIFRIDGTETVRITGFTLTRGTAVRGGAIRVLSGSPEIHDNLIRQNSATVRGSGIFLGGTSTAWIHHNVLWENYDIDFPGPGDPHGIDALDSAGGVIEHNLIGRGDSNGLFTQVDAAPVIRHNIFFENGVAGVRGRGICLFGPPTTEVAHNLFFGNAIADILVAGPGDLTAGAANDLSATDAIFGNLTGDPLLLAPEAGDFRLQWGSPAIDAGDPSRPFDPDGTVADLGPFFFDQNSTHVVESIGSALSLPSPNPFSRTTRVHFLVPRATEAKVWVHDVQGRRIASLHSGPLPAGEHHWSWDGRNQEGDRAPTGVYFLRIDTPHGSESAKSLLVR